jgi:hypothetical protein
MTSQIYLSLAMQDVKIEKQLQKDRKLELWIRQNRKMPAVINAVGLFSTAGGRKS